MKLNVVSILLISTCITTYAQQSKVKHNQLPHLKFPDSDKPLMVSDLPKNMLKPLNLTGKFSYAKGHQFYDTPIELVDDKGNHIKLKSEFNPKAHYTQAIHGKITLAENNIWFFSPDGTDQVVDEPMSNDFCYAENPCKALTQNIVNGIHNYVGIYSKDGSAKLWFATGTYDLQEIHDKYNWAKLIELYDRQYVYGRTDDFRHASDGNERPLILGTLSWNDYTEHGGIVALVSDIKMETEDNFVKVEDLQVNTNLHSTGAMYLFNTELNKSSLLSWPGGSNVVANTVGVFYSDLVNDSEKTFSDNHNIDAHEVNIYFSSLEVKGYGVSNLNINNENIIKNDTITVSNSKLLAKDNSCRSQSIVGLNIYFMSINDTSINITSDGACFHDYDALRAINVSGGDSEPASIYLEYTNIDVSSVNGNAEAIRGGFAEMALDGTDIHVSSTHGQTSGIFVYDIKFYGAVSYLTLSSPNPGLFFPWSVNFINKSTPPSQCRINKGTWETCHLP